MFSVGQNIVYPMHGAGVVEAIEQRVIGGNSANYYKVRIFSGNINLMVPVENTAGVQMRDVIDNTRAEHLLSHFMEYASGDDVPWNKRYKVNVERLKSGDIEKVASVFCDLIGREKTHGLSTSDRKMFILTKNIFCSELAVALGCEREAVFDSIMQTI